MAYRGKVSVVGQGYVGLTLSRSISNAGWKVIGIEIDEKRSTLIKAAQSPIEDVSNADIRRMSSELGYEVSGSFASISGSEFVVVCVPTPLDQDQKPDLSILESAIRSISANLDEGALIINESTSYPGTVRHFIQPLVSSIRGNNDFELACAPERVDPGNRIWNQSLTTRIVGGLTERSTKRAQDFYRTFCNEVVTVSSPEVAEFAKLLENTFRQVNIALVNELARFAHLSQIDIWEVIEAASTKPFGFMKFNPSVGVGGHCIPVDPLYLSNYAKNYGMPLQLIELAQRINDGQPDWIVSRAKKLLSENLHKKKVHLIGLAYKAGTADLRESPSIKLLNKLVSEGAIVTWQDDEVSEFQGSSSVEIPADVDLVIICHVPTESTSLQYLYARAKRILDCTGSIPLTENLFKL